MSNRRTKWLAALIIISVILVCVTYYYWAHVTAQSSAARFALLCLFEAGHQLTIRRPQAAAALVRAAAQSLGVTVFPDAARQSALLERLAIARTQSTTSLLVLMLRQISWIAGIALTLLVYFWRERALAHVTHERELLRDKLLAISSGWMLATVKPGSVKEVIAHILHQVTQYTDITSVQILSQTGETPDVALHAYSSSGPTISDALHDISAAMLRVEAGAIGEVLRTRRPWFSGVHGEVGTILPGIRLANTAVYPLVDRDATRGVMVLHGTGRQWNAQLADLIAIIAREIAILLTYATMEEDAMRLARYEEMNRLRSALLANVSHELRTPLGIMQGYAETLVYRGEQLSHAQEAEFARLIVDEARQLDNQINKLLKVATWESTGVRVRSDQFLAAAWITRVQNRLAVNTRVTLHLTGDLQTALQGDADELLDATFNLIDNAMKYSPGVIDLFISLPAGSLRVVVVDRGAGVDRAALDRIFERFYRDPAHARSEIRGSGLGLSIVKEIVEAHLGEIWAKIVADGFEVGFALPIQIGQGGR